ncbi:hypothetical protein [Bradyrhizobium sp. 33ap4]|uniref:hypothetical protein n=1 Tax=Bradyrhizobium sp. 33ap4 TaxID=3061630 RepID=UPI00292F5405|nr:hypothetical protein [Bradyrhizobium sp. 33ap4]
MTAMSSVGFAAIYLQCATSRRLVAALRWMACEQKGVVVDPTTGMRSQKLIIFVPRIWDLVMSDLFSRKLLH